MIRHPHSEKKDTGKDYFYEDNDVERRFRKWNV